MGKSRWIAVVGASVIVACSSGGTTTGDQPDGAIGDGISSAEGGDDSPADTTSTRDSSNSDATSDSADAPSDDGTVDAGDEAADTSDTGPDVLDAADAPSDVLDAETATVDAGTETATVDAETDVGAETPPIDETGTDATSDAGSEVATAAEAGPDASIDETAVAETGSETSTSPETGSDSADSADTGSETPPVACSTPGATQCNGSQLEYCAPTVTCVPKTSADYPSSNCGFLSDGCSNFVLVNNCPDACGSNVPNVCNEDATPTGSTCTPKTCADLGANCGSAPDGCGSVITCGACDIGSVCGAGGTPNVCATSSTGTWADDGGNCNYACVDGSATTVATCACSAPTGRFVVEVDTDAPTIDGIVGGHSFDDTATGLHWSYDLGTKISGSYGKQEFTNAQAVFASDSDNTVCSAYGAGSWRLPTMDELSDILAQAAGPVPGSSYPGENSCAGDFDDNLNMEGEGYWSSTLDSAGSRYAVTTANGTWESYAADSTATFHIRCVHN